VVNGKWAYKVLTQIIDPTFNEKMLNEMGSEGWELVSVVATPSALHFFFKKPK
jgi:hypothetical protein